MNRTMIALLTSLVSMHAYAEQQTISNPDHLVACVNRHAIAQVIKSVTSKDEFLFGSLLTNGSCVMVKSLNNEPVTWSPIYTSDLISKVNLTVDGFEQEMWVLTQSLYD